jgi:hypothetical protein
VAAQVTERVSEDFGAAEVDHLFLQVHRNGCILDQRIEDIGRHPLIGIPIPGTVPEPGESKTATEHGAKSTLLKLSNKQGEWLRMYFFS